MNTLQVNTVLYTKNGAMMGNALVTRILPNNRFELITDYGSRCTLRLNEIINVFAIGEKTSSSHKHYVKEEDMNEIASPNVRLDKLENIVEKIGKDLEVLREAVILSKESILKVEERMDTLTGLRIREIDENTPVNTLVKRIGGSVLLFYRGNGKISASPFSESVGFDASDIYVVDTLEDLKFKMFLNAPKGYNHGRIDANGCGYVYKEKPKCAESRWFLDGSGAHVGKFSQYRDEWKIIEVERD